MGVGKILTLVGLLGIVVLLPGCPGMPGAAGGGEQRMPPGVLPPPGLENGGARTLMGATITAPDNSYLLVRFTSARADYPYANQWHTCRRILPLDGSALIEGINYDGRADNVPKDANQLVPYAQMTSFEWKYEAKPAPPAGEGSTAKPTQGRKGARSR